MSAQELKDKNLDQLKVELIELRTEQFKLRMQKNSGETAPKPHLYKRVRRNIARVKTIMRQKEE